MTTQKWLVFPAGLAVTVIATPRLAQLSAPPTEVPQAFFTAPEISFQ